MKVALIHLKDAHTDRTVLMESVETTTRKANHVHTENAVSMARAAAILQKDVHILQADALTDRAVLTEKTVLTERTDTTLKKAHAHSIVAAIQENAVHTEIVVLTTDSTVSAVLREDAHSLDANQDSRKTTILPHPRKESTE